MEAVKTKRIGKYLIEIYQDEDSLNPRVDYDNLGTMACFHRRYSLGDKHDFSDPDELREFIESDEVVVSLPLYLYDHSGITMSTGPFSCPWDSGQVGAIYVTKEKMIEEYGVINDETIEKAKSVLEGEVETYDQYLTGDVYGYKVFEVEECNLGHEHKEEVHSCWSYFGDVDEYCMKEAEEYVNYLLSENETTPVE